MPRKNVAQVRWLKSYTNGKTEKPLVGTLLINTSK